MLTQHRSWLDCIAKALEQEETLDDVAIEKLIGPPAWKLAEAAAAANGEARKCATLVRHKVICTNRSQRQFQEYTILFQRFRVIRGIRFLHAECDTGTDCRGGRRGAGGAGFPTHVKLAGKADTVLLNAAECEPLLHKDKEVLRDYLDANIEGMAIAMQLVGAGRAIVGIKDKYDDVIELLRSRLPQNMEVCPLRDAYPAGDEFILVYDALGRLIPPGGIPLAVNAVVMNVETAVNVAAAASQPVTEKFLTIAGAVAEPVTLRVPIGVTLSQCVAAAGGATVPDANYMVGGVMMGTLQPDHEALVDKTTGGVIVLPDDHVLIRRRKQTWKQVARIGQSACDQCSFCTELCPRWLLGHPIEPHRAMRSLGFNMVGEANTIGTNFCCECNLCSLYSCPEDLDPKEVCTQNKRRLAAEKKKLRGPALRHPPGGNAPAEPQGAHDAADPKARPAAVPQRRAAAARLAAGRQGRHQAQAAHRRAVRAGWSPSAIA